MRLYRPFSVQHFLQALPKSVRAVAILDRTKEVGAPGEPLYLDVLSTFAHATAAGKWLAMPKLIGGRYGLSSKDFDPAMAKAVFDELKKPDPKHGFTVGINDDVSHTSLAVESSFDIESPHDVRALFYGLGADGTVGANKNSVKILADDPGRYAQGYFVYDSKKSGSSTISHLRFGPKPIRAPYLLKSASFVGLHKFDFVFKPDVLGVAAPEATVLINSPHGHDVVWDELPRDVQQQLIDKKLKLFVVDATKVAFDLGLGARINTILQTCFFALSGVLPRDEAIAAIKSETQRTYARKGAEVVKRNFAAIDNALANLHEVKVPDIATGSQSPGNAIPADAPVFVREITAVMIEGRGDTLPVSAMPIDGTFPTGTTKYEKRNIAEEVPIWEPDLCIQCGQCAIVCPHSVIRAKYYDRTRLDGAPEGFKALPINARGYPDSRYTLQVYVEDCTGCGVCVENCPAHSPDDAKIKAINMKSRLDHLAAERESIAFFEKLPWADRTRVNFANVRGMQFLQPLFEFSSACAGCGETPYLKLLSQLFGDRLQIANATGCSSIYGGNLPTTPWTFGPDGRGPAWANSLFEDNAEFGLGYRMAIDTQTEIATGLARKLAPQLGEDLVQAILAAPQVTESDFRVQRDRVGALKAKLATVGDPDAKNLLALADFLVHRSVWIVGGDGWAYDIGYGGLDHVLASGRNVNILVLDTGCIPTPAARPRRQRLWAHRTRLPRRAKVPRKDLAMMAISTAMSMSRRWPWAPTTSRRSSRSARPRHTTAHPDLAYSQILHRHRPATRYEAGGAGGSERPLAPLRFDPTMRSRGMNPFRLDSPRPRICSRNTAAVRCASRFSNRPIPAKPATCFNSATCGRGAVQVVQRTCFARRQPVPSALAGAVTMDLSTSTSGWNSASDHRVRLATDIDA